MGADPMITRSDYVVPFVSNPHSISHVKDDDAHMMSFDDPVLEPSIGERDLLGMLVASLDWRRDR